MTPDDDDDLAALNAALAAGWGDPDDPRTPTWGRG